MFSLILNLIWIIFVVWIILQTQKNDTTVKKSVKNQDEAIDITREAIKLSRENNRLLKEILVELKSRPATPKNTAKKVKK